ncbi:MAG TPA: hypothetical protein VG754_05950 [Verrucomicrobiae bacterium]|nr:hypothetical protein [Verrucomicrobiae bacterium]
MKPFIWSYLSLVALSVSLIIPKANAIPMEIPGPGMDIPKNGTGPGGGNGVSPSDDFFRLQNIVLAYDLAHPLTPLPTPIFTGNESLSSPDVGSGGLTGFDYAVLHYGVGNGGVPASGGGIEIFYLNGASSFDFPANGSGPNGLGGFSGLVLFEGTPPSLAPDGGMTLGFLAVGIGCLAVARRFTHAKA